MKGKLDKKIGCVFALQATDRSAGTFAKSDKYCSFNVMKRGSLLTCDFSAVWDSEKWALNLMVIISTYFRYIPVLMQQAKIYWDMENYQQVEKIFRKSVEFCNEHDIWKLNVAHVLFMQENKYKEATGFYEPIVKKNYDNVSLFSV